MDIDTAAGQIKRHGTFFDVAKTMPAAKASGISCMYVVGALERDNGWGDGDVALATEESLNAAPKVRLDMGGDGDDSDGR
jgi:hypothetical protein